MGGADHETIVLVHSTCWDSPTIGDGLSEVIGPGVSQECIETKDGLTIWEDHFYPEVIDPDTGEVVDPLIRRIAELQVEVDALKAQYSDLHPTLRAKKRELEDVLRQARERKPAEQGTTREQAALDPQLAPNHVESHRDPGIVD